MSRGGGTFEEPAQVPIRSSGRPCFKRPSAGHHDADHGGGEILGDGQRADRGQEGDEVHPDPSSAEAVHHRPQRVGGPDGAGHDPTAFPAVAAPARWSAPPTTRQAPVTSRRRTAKCRPSHDGGFDSALTTPVIVSRGSRRHQGRTSCPTGGPCHLALGAHAMGGEDRPMKGDERGAAPYRANWRDRPLETGAQPRR